MAVNVGGVTVSLDRAHLKARMERGSEAAGAALSGRVEKIDGDWAATWNTVYAAHQFYGCWPDGSHVVHNHTQGYTENPSTQWTEVTRARYAEDWRAVAQKEHTKGAE